MNKAIKNKIKSYIVFLTGALFLNSLIENYFPVTVTFMAVVTVGAWWAFCLTIFKEKKIKNRKIRDGRKLKGIY